MTDFVEGSSRRLGGQFAGHVSMPGDKLTATRELHAMMQGRVVSRGDEIIRARGRYGTEQRRVSQRYLRCVRHPQTCRQPCGLHVNTGSPYRCAAGDMAGREAPYALMGS